MLLRLLTACVLLLPLSLGAMELKISTLYPDGTAAVNRLKEAGKQLAEESDGRVSLRIYAGGTMGDDRAVQRRIRIGQLHGSLAQAGAFASSYKDSQILNLPLAFRSLEEVDHVRAELDPVIRDGFEDNGWVVFGPVDGGFAYLMSRDPVASVSDLQRQKVWLPAGDTGSAVAAREFGISPVVLNLGAVLTSLQTGVIDTFAAPAVPALTLQWYTRVSHLTEMPLLYTYGVLALGKQHVDRLSDEDQATLRRVLSETADEMNRAERADNQRAMEALKGQGLEVVEPSAEQLQEWRKLARQATDRLVSDGEISEDMLARLNALLDEYRGN